MKINREGYASIIIVLLFSAVVLFGVKFLACHFGCNTCWYTYVVRLTAVVLAYLCFKVIYFFREPKRELLQDENCIYAPCDGEVVVTENVFEDEYLKEEVMQISIFMSPSNVHVNWSPVGGVIEYFKHHAGKFLVAWHPKSSTENERTTTVVRTQSGERVLFRQIAGFVARRIVTYTKEGEQMMQNQMYGFIKFGSRIDIFVPKSCVLQVAIGDKTVGSQSVIAKFK